MWWFPNTKKIWRPSPAACANLIVSRTSWIRDCMRAAVDRETLSSIVTVSSTSSSGTSFSRPEFMKKKIWDCTYQLGRGSPAHRPYSLTGPSWEAKLVSELTYTITPERTSAGTLFSAISTTRTTFSNLSLWGEQERLTLWMGCVYIVVLR